MRILGALCVVVCETTFALCACGCGDVVTDGAGLNLGTLKNSELSDIPCSILSICLVRPSVFLSLWICTCYVFSSSDIACY